MQYLEYEGRILEALVGAINALPHATASLRGRELPIGGGTRLDGMIDVELAGAQIVLLVDVKREVFPRDVHGAIFHLVRSQRHIATGDQEVLLLLAAESVSAGARELLTNEGIGFFDLGGSLFLPSKAAFVLIDRSPPKKTSHTVGSVFEGQKAHVLQVALQRGDAPLGVKDLAEQARVAPSTVSTTLAELERRDWAESFGSGPHKVRHIINPSGLLDSWRDHIRKRKPPRIARYYVPVGDITELGRQLDVACQLHEARYAVTGELAAQIYTPYLSSVSQLRCRIEPGSAQTAVLRGLDARQVSEGWNFGLIETQTADDIETGERIAGLQLAPPLRIYLDLLQGTGRSQDMADHFRHERLEI